MKRFLLVLVAGLGVALTGTPARAEFGSLSYGGYQPKWAFWARSNRAGYYANCEEERWQKFWHDYYNALKCYYGRLDNIDWVTYYKFHGYQINGGGCGPAGCGAYGRPQYAPVFVSPAMQWAVPSAAPGCAPGH
jgi:hypothetical protein